ncbi:hypothetical protein V1527DRAFT_481167 [Lipomyces starkeyi]
MENALNEQTTEDGNRECRNFKKRIWFAKFISGKESSSKPSSSTLLAHATTCFRLGARKVPQELVAAHLSTKAQNGRLLKWIVDDHYPPSALLLMGSTQTQYAIPTRKTITRRIVSTYASCLNDMKSRLHALDSKVSWTYDVWTSKAKLPYASVKVQYVDADWKRARPPAFFHDLIVDTIQSFGLETRGFSCVSDNEEATVQGLMAVKVDLERDYKNSASSH